MMTEELYFEADRSDYLGIDTLPQFIKIQLLFVLIIVIAIPLVSLFVLNLEDERLIFYASFAVLLFYFVLIFFLFRRSRKIKLIRMTENTLDLEYIKGFSDERTSLLIKDTAIELFEIKDSGGLFTGVQINLNNKSGKGTFKMFDTEWEYDEMKRFYTEFKKRKKEQIPDAETEIFKQLQRMSNPS